jgi:hypothetical protein
MQMHNDHRDERRDVSLTTTSVLEHSNNRLRETGAILQEIEVGISCLWTLGGKAARRGYHDPSMGVSFYIQC